jgi:hypothetical protein
MVCMDIIADIKKKKELASIDDSLIKKYLKNKNIPKNKRAKKYKEIIKEVRAKLRRDYGMFVRGKKGKRQEILDQITKLPLNKTKELHKDILVLHTSTKERLPYYKDLYKELLNKPASILDLGAGLNPFSYPFMKTKKLQYTAVELTKEDADLLNQYFAYLNKQNKEFAGKAIKKNLKETTTLPKTDVCFMFKLLDILETKGHKLAEHLLKIVKAKIIIVSFPTITIGNKPMRNKRRIWFERLLQRLNYSHKTILIPNEIFYVVEK